MKVNFNQPALTRNGEHYHEKFELLQGENGEPVLDERHNPIVKLNAEGKPIPTDKPVTYAMYVLKYLDTHLMVKDDKKSEPLSKSDRYALGKLCNKLTSSEDETDISADEAVLIKDVTALYCHSNSLLAQIFDLVDPKEL